jgi:MmyB-like transcription regulator ligand binding domain
MLDRLTDVPVMVFDTTWELIAWNPLAAALLGEPAARPGRQRNIVWRYFTGQPGRVVRDAEADAVFEADVVADLHAALGRYPHDPTLLDLIADLRAANERFAQLWNARPVAVTSSSRKTFEHPEVGRLTLNCDILTVQGSDLRIVVYTPRPGSPDADTLALIGVLGLQDLSAEDSYGTPAGSRPRSA